ncbi:MAG: Uma2 family endonuclease [Cyanobacteriota bacterium]|nr:Uma2 family endonuclease [Cyanobacteriota bacterium]
MIQLQSGKFTFEEYLAYEDETDNRYELIDGVLIPLPPESEPNLSIANYLFLILVNAGIPFRLVHPHSCEIQVPIIQAGDAANRYPDLVVLAEEHLKLTQKRLTLTLEMPPPRLVVEVVSPGKIASERDYERKPLQYAARGIQEYWIVDRQRQMVAVLCLESQRYVQTVFRGSARIHSPTFPQLSLTAEQIFALS